MPELPEVECTLQSLQAIQGQLLVELAFSSLAPLKGCQAKQVKELLEGLKLKKLKRRGKYLIFCFEKDRNLVLHLGMSGRLLYHPKKVSPPTHTHLRLLFANQNQVHYTDARRFGSLSLSFKNDFSDNPRLRELGPDYDDPKLSPKQFIKRARRHPKLHLKSLCLNQKIAAGLGNIYACESLYKAGLDPRRLVANTKDPELKTLLKSAQKVLAQGIKQGGVSLRDYINGLGHRGVMQNYLQVYDREGKLSLDGQGKVKRIVQNQRSTWFCPEVQK